MLVGIYTIGGCHRGRSRLLRGRDEGGIVPFEAVDHGMTLLLAQLAEDPSLERCGRRATATTAALATANEPATAPFSTRKVVKVVGVAAAIPFGSKVHGGLLSAANCISKRCS